MERSEHIEKLAAALVQAQLRMANPVKGEENTFYSTRERKALYADLAAVIDAYRKPLAEEGLSLVQSFCTIWKEPLETSLVKLETMLVHVSGEWMKETTFAPAAGRARDGKLKLDAQTIGSAVTYLRRYQAQAMLGLAGTDDDGNEASDQSEGRQEQAVQERAAPAARQVDVRAAPAAAPAAAPSATEPEPAGIRLRRDLIRGIAALVQDRTEEERKAIHEEIAATHPNVSKKGIDDGNASLMQLRARIIREKKGAPAPKEDVEEPSEEQQAVDAEVARKKEKNGRANIDTGEVVEQDDDEMGLF